MASLPLFNWCCLIETSCFLDAVRWQQNLKSLTRDENELKTKELVKLFWVAVISHLDFWFEEKSLPSRTDFRGHDSVILFITLHNLIWFMPLLHPYSKFFFARLEKRCETLLKEQHIYISKQLNANEDFHSLLAPACPSQQNRNGISNCNISITILNLLKIKK